MTKLISGLHMRVYTSTLAHVHTCSQRWGLSLDPGGSETWKMEKKRRHRTFGVSRWKVTPFDSRENFASLCENKELFAISQESTPASSSKAWELQAVMYTLSTRSDFLSKYHPTPTPLFQLLMVGLDCIWHQLQLFKLLRQPWLLRSLSSLVHSDERLEEGI